MNDPMRELVYSAECGVWGSSMFRNDFPTPDAIVGVVREITESSAVRQAAPAAAQALNPVLDSACKETYPNIFVFEKSLGQRQFFLQLPRYEPVSEFKCTSKMIGLKFPEHGRNKPIIGHEVAHLLRFLQLGLSGYSREEDHGAEFQETYIEVTKPVLGLDSANLLRSAFIDLST